MDHFQERRPYQPFAVSTDAVATVPDDTTTVDAAEHDMPQDAATDGVTHVAAARDVSPDIATEPEDTPRQDDDMSPVDRENFTLTVEDVAVRLAEENIYRDPRTIQRWCKSGKLDCLLDAENGEKYLIEPTSLNRIVATLINEQERQARAMSRHRPDTPRSATRQEETLPDSDAPPAATGRDTSRPVSDDSRDSLRREANAQKAPAHEGSAELQTRVQELEVELAMTKADKEVREQMVDYLKDQFAQMLDGALDRSEQIGELRAENTQLKNLLDAGPSPHVDNASGAPPGGHVQ